jgi:predicted nuclease of predicted toxin-antitoxin system
LLLDTCMWQPTADDLRADGHDVIWSGEWDVDPGDAEILAIAFREQRVLITLDNDFGELALKRKLPHAGIIRIVDPDVRRHSAICRRVLHSHAEQLAAGAVVAADDDRTRPHLVRH